MLVNCIRSSFEKWHQQIGKQMVEKGKKEKSFAKAAAAIHLKIVLFCT